ncbi:MAG: hypothetical protein Q9182_001023 [Xanthomendoza sp. 2 TL-2023]
MASPTELSRRDSHVDRSGKSTPQAPTPVPLTTPYVEPSVDFQSFVKAFSQYTESVVETATIQVRCEALKHDEQQQISEHDRWSKYFGSFIAIDEDQARGLTTIKKSKDHAQKQLNLAQKESEKAKNAIAKTIFAATTGRRIVDVDSDANGQMAKEASRHMIQDLKDEIENLKQDIFEIRKRQDCEICDLQRTYPSKKLVHEIENKLDKRIVKEAERITGLANVAAKNDDVKKDLRKMENKHIQNAVKLEVEKLSESFATRLMSQREDFKNDTEVAQAKTTKLLRSEFQSELQKHSDTAATKSTPEPVCSSNDLDTSQAQEQELIRSEIKSETERLERLISTNTCTIASLEPQVSAFGECVDSFTGFRNTVENTIQNLKRDSASREKAIKNLESGQEALNSSIQHLTEQFNELSRNVDNSIRGHGESCREERDQLRIEQISLKAQMASQESITERLREQFPATLSGHTGAEVSNNENGDLAPSIQRLERDIEKRYRLLSRRLDERQHVEDTQDLYMKEHVEEVNNLHIMLKDDLNQLTADVKTLNEERSQLKSDQLSISTSLEQLKAEVKILSADNQGQAEQCTRLCTTLEKLLTDVKALSETMQGHAENYSHIDQLRSENSSNLTDLKKLKADLTGLHETIGSSSERLMKLENHQREMTGLQEQARSNRSGPMPSPHQSPRVNGFTVTQDNQVKPKLEALDTKVELLENQVTDKVKSIESFVAAQEVRFNNLTTEPVVRSVVNQIEQRYPALSTLSRRQDHIEVSFGQFHRMVETEHETIERTATETRKSAQELFDTSKGLMRKSVNEIRQEIQAHCQNVEELKRDSNLKLQHLEQRITTNLEAKPAQPDPTTITSLMQEHSKLLQEFGTRVGLLEQREDGDAVDNLDKGMALLSAKIDALEKQADEVSISNARHLELPSNLHGVSEQVEDKSSFQTDTHTAAKRPTEEPDASEKTGDVRTGDQTQEMKNLGLQLDDFQKTFAGSPKFKGDVERLQLGLDKLKTKVDCGAQDVAQEIESLKQMLEDATKKTATQGKIINEVYDVALERVESLYKRVIALESSKASSHGDDIPAVVDESLQDDVHKVSSESDRDAHPVKPGSKRSREPQSHTGSLEREFRKKPRGRRRAKID